MTIKNRLFLLSAVITVAVLSMLALQQYTTQRADLLRQGITTLLDVEADMQILLATKRDYLLSRSQKSRDLFFHEQEELVEELHELSEVMNKLDLDSSPISHIENDLKIITEKFITLEALMQRIGLNENEGLRGALRRAAHQAEAIFRTTEDYRLLAGLLMMRRHEKDFLLRQNEKYVQKHEATHRHLIDTIEQSRLLPETQDSALHHLDSYVKNFQTLVATKRQLGLQEGQGVRAELNGAIRRALENQAALVKVTRNTIKQARITQNQILFTGTLLLIITLVSMALFIARSVSRSLSRITAAMEQVADGNAALSVTLPESGSDETSQIARAFNRFTAKLDDTVNQVLMVATNLSQSSLRAQEITQATSNSIEEQVGAITHLTDTISQMAESSQQVRVAISDASDTAREVQRKATEGHTVVDSAVDGMREMQAEVSRLEQSISALTGHHEDVGQVLDMIITIAEQTNLLALNAAIEAARAGEYGRGFAVVADEVRALSQRTTEATDEVRKLMDTIRIGNQEAVSLMACSAEASARNMERTQAAGETFTVITQAVGEINDSNVQVSTLAEQQSALADEVRDNIRQIHKSVSELSELARKNISDNGDLSQFSVQLESLVAGFSSTPQPQDKTEKASTAVEGVELF